MTSVVSLPSSELGQQDDTEHSPPRIQVSLDKKSKHFYVSLARKLLQQHGEVRLSALGFAMDNMVWVAETLKRNGLAIEIQLLTSLDILSEGRPRPVKKYKMEILLAKSENFEAALKEQARLAMERREMRMQATKENTAKEPEKENIAVEVERQHTPEPEIQKQNPAREVEETDAPTVKETLREEESA